MFLLPTARLLLREIVQVELPVPNMKIDPRPNNYRDCRFQCVYHKNGTTVTLTRTDDKRYFGDGPFEFRVYDPATEVVPDFRSTIYTYLGVDRERAPLDTTLLLIDPSVKIIKKEAFKNCGMMRKCFMHDGVHTIEKRAFECCGGMKTIRLSRNLERIAERAFEWCMSLEALFLPPNIKKIDTKAFRHCKDIRILPLPPDISIDAIGDWIIRGCYTFFRITQIQRYRWDDFISDRCLNKDDVHQSVLDFYRNFHPLHQICLHTNITAQAIDQFIYKHGTAAASLTDYDGMTPLHILSMNPHADSGAIAACFHANMSAVFARDSRCKTPLDYVMDHHNIEDHTSLITHLCMHRESMRTGDKMNNP